MHKIIVHTNQIPIRLFYDDQVVNTTVHTYSIRVSDGIDWDKVHKLIEQAVAPLEHKEVITVLTYSDEFPEDAAVDDLFIYSTENKLFKYYGDDDGWAEEEAAADILYVASDTSSIYLYNGSEFVDATGRRIDDTIYVRNLTTDLADIIDKGIYTVCLATSANLACTYYTLVVNKSTRMGRPTRITYYSQLLYNHEVYMIRSKTNAAAWGEWQEHYFFFHGDSAEYVQDETLNMSQDQVNAMLLGEIDDLQTQVRAAL